ncbi:MAG TPA: acyl-CoA dehydrogenase family protein, partial [Galbitalea sp.]|nr:acyl-CoA dehydrogenase family protein [Galbitalea sp.]
MDFAFDQRTTELRATLLEFMADRVYPAEAVLAEQLAASSASWAQPPIVAELQAEARKRGLWNLFLPGTDGAGLSNLQYAPLCEILGRSPKLAPVATNCSAPDTGNMELLSEYGTAAQKAEWLDPLLDGSIRSSFSMS